MSSVVLMIEGYDDDPREIYAIPEVRAFYQQLWERWPYWLFFCNLDTENLMTMVMCCLDSLDALKVKGRDQVNVSIDPLEVVRFISGGFGSMNEMCERAGMNERQIFDRTKAVFEYFNLPFDAGPPPRKSQPMPSAFQPLIAEATRYARFTMKKSGSLAPIMMASTDQGIIVFSPDSMSDTGAKDDFANKVRLITGSYGASAVVLILESWITKAKVGEKLDTETLINLEGK